MGSKPGTSGSTFRSVRCKNSDKFELLAISIDDERAPAERFASDMQLPFPVLLDLHSQAANAYGVDAIPCPVLVDGDTGMILATDGGALGNRLARAVDSALAAKAKK